MATPIPSPKRASATSSTTVDVPSLPAGWVSWNQDSWCPTCRDARADPIRHTFRASFVTPPLSWDNARFRSLAINRGWRSTAEFVPDSHDADPNQIPAPS